MKTHQKNSCFLSTAKGYVQQRFSLRLTTVLMMLFAFLLLSHNVNGQTITCSAQVTDKISGKPVPFASVGIMRTKYGTVSNDSGYFELKFPDKFKNDTLRLQCIGYQPIKLKISELMMTSGRKGNTISIEPKAVSLNEVVVTSIEKKIKTFGYKGKTSTVFSVFSSNDAGLEMAQRMKVPSKPGLLHEINFGIAINPFDSCRLEIILYSIDSDGFPDQPMMNKPIYVTCKKKKGETQTISLTGENLSISNDFFISVKCLEKQNSKSMESPFTLNGAMGRHSYIRQSSEDNWVLERAIGLGINCKIIY